MLSEKPSGISMTNNNNRYDGYASNINMVDAPMKFQLGKRKEKSLAHEADENVFSYGDSARIGGNLTPIRNKRTKLLKMSPVESLLPTSHAEICDTKTGIRRDGVLEVRKLDVESEKYGIKERIELGRSLDMLVDAIQMVEDRKPQKLPTVEVHKKDLGFFLPENLGQGNDSVGMPGSGNHQCCENDAHELGLDIKSFEEQYPLKTGDIDGEEVMPRTRSSRGWLPTLPSKYSDSVLQPWKKVTRKAPKF